LAQQSASGQADFGDNRHEFCPSYGFHFCAYVRNRFQEALWKQKGA
jgi:hypothetical protein